MEKSLSKAEGKELRRIKKAGQAQTVSPGLNGLVKEGHTTPDPYGGYTVDYYVLSDHGNQYLKHRKKQAILSVLRPFYRAIGKATCFLGSASLQSLLVDVFLLLIVLSIAFGMPIFPALQELLRKAKEAIKWPE